MRVRDAGRDREEDGDGALLYRPNSLCACVCFPLIHSRSRQLLLLTFLISPCVSLFYTSFFPSHLSLKIFLPFLYHPLEQLINFRAHLQQRQNEQQDRYQRKLFCDVVLVVSTRCSGCTTAVSCWSTSCSIAGGNIAGGSSSSNNGCSRQ